MSVRLDILYRRSQLGFNWFFHSSLMQLPQLAKLRVHQRVTEGCFSWTRLTSHWAGRISRRAGLPVQKVYTRSKTGHAAESRVTARRRFMAVQRELLLCFELHDIWCVSSGGSGFPTHSLRFGRSDAEWCVCECFF